MQLTESELQLQFGQLIDLVSQTLPHSKACEYNAMLQSLKRDPIDNTDAFYLLGMLRAPAAKGNHHAFEGGMVYHYLEMWEAWLGMRGGVVGRDEQVTDERILCGIINHDLHKAWRTYQLLSREPWMCQYAADWTDKLLEISLRAPDGVIKSLYILQRNRVSLDEIDYNVILNAGGGFSRTQTYWCSVVAKLCYLLDELSGNVIGRQAAGKWLGHNQVVVEEMGTKAVVRDNSDAEAPVSEPSS